MPFPPVPGVYWVICVSFQLECKYLEDKHPLCTFLYPPLFQGAYEVLSKYLWHKRLFVELDHGRPIRLQERVWATLLARGRWWLGSWKISEILRHWEAVETAAQCPDPRATLPGVIRDSPRSSCVALDVSFYLSIFLFVKMRPAS